MAVVLKGAFMLEGPVKLIVNVLVNRFKMMFILVLLYCYTQSEDLIIVGIYCV